MGSQNVQRNLERANALAELENLAAVLVFGNAHSTGEHFPDVGAGNTKQLYLENTSSDMSLVIIGPAARGGASFVVSKAFNPTVDAAGDPPSTGIQNKSSDGTATTNATAAIGGDNETGGYSNGDRFSPKQLGGGSSPASVTAGQAGSGGATNLVAPGDSILIEGTNDSSNAANLSLDVDWIEVPTDFIESDELG